jgi:hypothetical protein
MAQKAFMADAGVRLGEWSIVELGNGDLQVSNMHTISGSQKMFRVDKGLRMGDWRMTVDGNGDMNLSETAITGSQRPFIADGGVRVGAWTLRPTEDGDLYAEKDAEFLSYSLSCDYSTVNEGGTVIISLATTAVADGTTLPYTISGVASADIDNASLTGNFVVGTTDSITLNITADSTTEGTETLQISLDNGNSNIKYVTINDTSTTPVSNPTYSIAQSHTGSVDEGTSVTFTLNTTDVADGTTLYYTTSYSSGGGGSSDQFDFTGANSGQVTVNNNTTNFTVLVSADMVTESGNNEYEGFYGNFGTSWSWQDYVATSQVIEINDTSQAPTGPQAPSVGTMMYGGETIAPGWWESHWNGSNTLTVKFDTASTSTSGWGTTNDQWEYVLDDWAAGNGSGDTIELRGDGGLRILTINGTVTKTQIGSSDSYYYAIPVSVTTGTMGSSAGYIVSPIYLQHQYNG